MQESNKNPQLSPGLPRYLPDVLAVDTAGALGAGHGRRSRQRSREEDGPQVGWQITKHAAIYKQLLALRSDLLQLWN